MTPPKLTSIALLILAAFIFMPTFGQSGNDESALVGDWRGESFCQVRESACHDEDSLYHIEKLAGKPHWFSLRGDKIVQGKPVTMGTVECLHDAAKHMLTCEFPRGVFQFTIAGNKMQGTMTLPDKTVWRKISLTRVEP
jgi:hypothetical protein